jgi:nucleotide-binding universal stress UspA family protein
MYRHQHLMVGLAHNGEDIALIRYAAMVVRLGTINRVCFVHVLPDSRDTVAPTSPPCCEEVLTELQNEVKAHFTNVSENVKVTCYVSHGPVLDRLLTHAADNHVDLLLVGQGREASGRRVLARRLAMKAPCSVWLIPSNVLPQLRRVLVPVDFSENAADAVQVAGSLTRHNNPAECLLLHVYFNEAMCTFEGYEQVLQAEKEQDYRQFIAPISCPNVRLMPLFEEGVNVAHAIGRVAKQRDVNLIVMSTRGRSRSAAILLGSVTEAVILETSVPLLAVKHFGARMGVLQALLDRRFRERGDLHTD